MQHIASLRFVRIPVMPYEAKQGLSGSLAQFPQGYASLFKFFIADAEQVHFKRSGSYPFLTNRMLFHTAQ